MAKEVGGAPAEGSCGLERHVAIKRTGLITRTYICRGGCFNFHKMIGEVSQRPGDALAQRPEHLGLKERR